ncbi:hypothetical protein L1049_025958 [Liquidambar formosana]|uniref:CST complex subunit CTC1 n=1 Tax=Liquidambar formosana TaxID=63359 RepID=A0AAP0NG15_LIQFO
MDGIPEQGDHSGLLESFSCRSIFRSFPSAKETNLAIYVYFHLRNATCRNLLFHPRLDWKDDLKELYSGTFHLLLITHRLPLLQKFQGDPVISNRSSMFAEAMVLPWDLFLAGKDGNMHPSMVSKEKRQKLMEHGDCGNYQEHASCKRCKIGHASIRASYSGIMDYSSDAGKESCGHLNDCSSPCRTCSVERKHCNLCSTPEIPCMATIRSVNNHSLVSSGWLCCRKANVNVSVGCKPSSRNLLLEFKSESIFKYQLLRIGDFYITKHFEEDLFCNLKDSEYLSGAKVLINSRTHLWSLSFSSDELLSYTDPSYDPALVESSFSNSEVLSGGTHQIELLFQRSSSKCLETYSDVDLHVSADALNLLGVDVNIMEKGLIKPSLTLEEVANTSRSVGTTVAASLQPAAIAESDCLLPEGNLISLYGHVVAVHTFEGSPLDKHLSHESLRDVHQLSFFQGVVSSVCIHLLMNHHIVRILGTLSKLAYPTGFGPGVNATFHRILQSSGQTDFMLTSVSHIVVNSIGEVNEQYSDKCSNLWSASNLYNVASLDSVSSGLISELAQCLACKPVLFHCRVLAIHILVLEKKDRKYDDTQSKSHTKAPVLNISLAGFVLDDGSSLCCCWANAERAATLLRLREKIPQNAFGSSCWRLKGTGMDKACRTALHHVDRILEKHGRITVKNYGSLFDSSCQDFSFSVSSDNAFSSSDEKILKFIILNACFGTVWTVLGSVMDLDSVGRLEKHLTDMEMTMHSMQNIWAREVHYTNTVTEARDLIQELLNG